MAETPTQEFLEVKDIREGVVMLKSGGIRGILMVSSLNFALKSVEEQSSIIFAYQSFLNSLDFSCQIVIQSRNVNITPYLDNIKALEQQQTSELMKSQVLSYVDFIKELVAGDNIMTKSFYVIVPYTTMEILGAQSALNQSGLFDFFKKDKNKQGGRQMSDEDFEKCKNQLWQRMEFLAMGLKRCGLDVMPLTTPELIELFWAMHHPDQAEIGYYPEILPELLK